MEVVQGSESIERKLRSPVLTIGNFDGLHLGHRAIMQIVTERAHALGGESVVHTFEPHPRKVVRPETAPKLLATLEQKLELLEGLGVDVAIVEPFDRDFMAVTPDRFVREYIHARIAPVELYVGYDFHFGRDREGSMRLLTELGPRLGFSVTIIPEVTVAGRDVNSTRIRDLLGEGAVSEVAQLLGRRFSVRGEVVVGDRRGRTLGFPTANLRCENEILPASGVYAGELVLLDDGPAPLARGVRLPVVTNVGIRPTFNDERGLLAEAHVIDFDGDSGDLELYDRRVELRFDERLRGELKFAGPEALREQIARDVDSAREVLGIDPA